MRISIIIALSSFLIAAPALATIDTAVIYTRALITILPKAQTNIITEHSPSAEDQPAQAVEIRQTIELEVELRPQSVLHQEGIFTHAPFEKADGLMVIVDAPLEVFSREIGIKREVDILMLDHEGFIKAIVPSITPYGTYMDIDIPPNLTALLFLEGGSYERQDIQINDRVDHSIFNPKPLVIQ